MMKYPKIKNVYARNLLTREPIDELYSTPEIEYLADYSWRFTEKIHGTNVRIEYNPEEVDLIKGKTEKAILPQHLMDHLLRVVDSDKMEDMFKETPTTLYGEGYGYKINGGGHYFANPKDVGFILFDVNCGGTWLDPQSVRDIATALSLECVPWRYTCSLSEAVKVVKQGLKSEVSFAGKFAEGLVGVPEPMLLDRHGKRIQVKIKHVDFYEGENNGHS